MKRLINQLTELLFALAGVLMLISQTLIVAFGAMVMLILVAQVEYNRVLHGLQYFELDAYVASMGAITLVLANLYVEFQIHARAQKDKLARSASKKEAQKKYKPSLRLYARSVAYFLGIGKKWKAEEVTGARRYETLATITTVAIITLALVGSMKASIVAVSDMTWHEGIMHIIEDSSLTELSTWAAGIVFTFFAVAAARGLTRFIAERVEEVKRDMERAPKVTRQAAAVERARPEWSGVRGEVAPIKHMVKGKRMYRCPVCQKDMTRQAWSKHGCRFTPELTPVDGVDADVDQLELVDVRQPVNQGVNRVNRGQ